MDSSHFRPLHEPSAYKKETELIDKGEKNKILRNQEQYDKLKKWRKVSKTIQIPIVQKKRIFTLQTVFSSYNYYIDLCPIHNY